MLWLLSNIRLIGIVGAIIATFYAGWHSHSIITEHRYKEQLESALKKSAETPAKIVRETQVITKVIHDSNDACVDKPMPHALIEQLRK